MYRKYLSTAFIYAVIAMVWGVFYREFTKFAGFSGKTALSVIHVHYFALGMISSCCWPCWRKILPFPPERA